MEMEASSTSVLDILTAIGSLVTPILIVVVSSAFLVIQRRIEAGQKREEALHQRALRLEEQIREERVDIYLDVLEPFVLMFAKDTSTGGRPSRRKVTSQQTAEEKLLSPEYRKAVFNLLLFASDDVARAFNSLMQTFYKMPSDSETSVTAEGTQPTAIDGVVAFGAFLLEVRKSIGNEGSALDKIEMLEWMITDIESLREQS